MPTLSPQERLQPALLDRLIDDEPDKKVESRESRVVSIRRLREAVLRDLAWLFNCTRPSDEELDTERHPHVARSTLAFGLPALAGNTASGMDIAMLESRIHAAITEFEPRLVPETLKVEAKAVDKTLDHHNQIEVQIRGSLWAQPVPIEILLKTEVDLESGQVEIQDLGG